MTNIYQSTLDQKFEAIMSAIAKELGYAENLNGLTVTRREMVESLAEQAIVNWAVDRKQRHPPPTPITNMQHLLDDYCAIAEHL